MIVLIIIGMLSYTGLRMSERNTPLVDASMEIKYELTLFHLWFEELVQGDTTLTETEVWQHLEQSQWYANAMLDGGQNSEGIYFPLDSPHLRKLITSSLAAIEMLKKTGMQRLQKSKVSQAGSDIDTKFDYQFQLALSSADKAKTAVQKLIQDELTQYRILSLTLAIIVICLGFIVSFIIKLYDKDRNQLLTQLSDSNKHLESQVDKQTHHLSEALKQTDIASKAKSAFLSSMSHELRTPLNAILGFGQILEMDAKDEITKQNIGEITSAGNHLLSLINDILDLSGIESGKLPLSIEDVFLKDVFMESLSLIMPLAKKRDIRVINPSSQCTGYHVRADYMRLKQVLLNLLSNAVKYNRKGGSITISGKSYPDSKMRISVTDTGMGMSESQLEQLFQEFNRVGAEQTDIEGTGIGLVITKCLVELMGGNIGVESQEGKGTSFWIELNQSESSEHISVEEEEKSADSTKVDNTEKSKKTILYIEDNPANLRLVSQIIKQHSSHDLISAPDGRLGVELAMTQLPELILLDINLPHQDGYAVLKRLRETDETKNIPVVAVTANAMKNDIAKGKKAGFADYITKPIDFKKLLDAISKVLD